jgi:hypothetical protein
LFGGIIVAVIVSVVAINAPIASRRAAAASPSIQVATDQHKQAALRTYYLESDMEDAVAENWGEHCWATSSETPSFYTVFSRWIGKKGLVSLTAESNGRGFSGISFSVTDGGSRWKVTPNHESPLESDKFKFVGQAPYECESFAVTKN